MTVEKLNLAPSKYTRPQRLRRETEAIVMHWTGKAMQRAVDVIDWWGTKLWYGSAHYVIDNDGTVYQAVPHAEIAYHCGSPTYSRWARAALGQLDDGISANATTIGVEMCILDSEGSYSGQCVTSASQLVARLLNLYGLGTDRIVTHNMVVDWKQCPRFWTAHPSEFELFRLRTSEMVPFEKGGA